MNNIEKAFELAKNPMGNTEWTRSSIISKN